MKFLPVMVLELTCCHLMRGSNHRAMAGRQALSRRVLLIHHSYKEAYSRITGLLLQGFFVAFSCPNHLS